MENWYVARVVLRCDEESGQEPWMFDEQIRLIRATDGDAAFERAVALGKAEELEYRNAEGELVRWTFCGLKDLELLDVDEIADGTEIASRRLLASDLSDVVTPREKLAVFWNEANKGKTAEELLSE